MTVVGLRYFQHVGHEIRALAEAALCACGNPSTGRSGRCDFCQMKHLDAIAEMKRGDDG